MSTSLHQTFITSISPTAECVTEFFQLRAELPAVARVALSSLCEASFSSSRTCRRQLRVRVPASPPSASVGPARARGGWAATAKATAAGTVRDREVGREAAAAAEGLRGAEAEAGEATATRERGKPQAATGSLPGQEAPKRGA